MSRYHRALSGAILAAALLSGARAGTGALVVPDAPPPPVAELHHYFPNFDGTTWSYVDLLDHEKPIPVASELVRRGRGEAHFRLLVDGARPATFAYGRGGLRLVALGDEATPVRLSSRKLASPGDAIRDGAWEISYEAPQEVLVKAGRFEDCLVLRVRETRDEAQVSNLRIFLARGVGPVLVEGKWDSRPVRAGLAECRWPWGVGTSQAE